MTGDDKSQGGSWALQGCLVGSVALFVVLLLVMLFLAFGRFREHTATPDQDLTFRPGPVPVSIAPSSAGPISASAQFTRPDA